MINAMALPEHYSGLRHWAAESRPLSAATELLIRTGLARPVAPWIQLEHPSRRPWINFDWLLEMADRYPDREQKLLRIAASLAGDCSIVLGEEIADLDWDTLDLVVAAIAHSGGWNLTRRTMAASATMTYEFPPAVALHPWPGTGP